MTGSWGTLSTRTLTGLWSGPMRVLWSSTTPSVRSCSCIRAIPSMNTDWRMNWLRPALWKRMWRYWWKKNYIWASSVLSQLGKPIASWAASKKMCHQQGKGGGFAPQLCSHETPAAVLQPPLGSLAQKDINLYDWIQRMATRRAVARLLWRTAERLQFV